MALSGKRILMVMAHPDDEILFGWPIFQDNTIQRELLVLVSDAHNPERTHINKRKDILLDICRTYNIPVTCWDYDSEFYRRLNGKKGEIRLLHQRLQKELAARECDFVFTHNPHGEYGHLDHMLLFQMVFHSSKKPLLITDICQENVWNAQSTISERERRTFYAEAVQECSLDKNIFAFCQEYYRHNPYLQNCWTWSRPVVDRCTLYVIA